MHKLSLHGPYGAATFGESVTVMFPFDGERRSHGRSTSSAERRLVVGWLLAP
jgi:hypothetical protein